MKTFDRKIADYSHSSLIKFSTSIPKCNLKVTKKVTTVTQKLHQQQILQVVGSVVFDFIFQAFRNGEWLRWRQK